MKTRAVLPLMEILVMVLVFSLAAAWCLQVFSRSVKISEDTARLDEAVALARNGAEILKSRGQDWELQLAGLEIPDGMQLHYEFLESGYPNLGKARIWVIWENETLFSLTVSWQEVAP